MKLLTGITDRPLQKSVITIDDGTAATITLTYRPNQQGWFFDLEWEGRSFLGMRLVTFPNILRPFLKQIPFGLAVYTQDGKDPLQQDAFASGYASLLLLSPEDMLAVEHSHFTRND